MVTRALVTSKENTGSVTFAPLWVNPTVGWDDPASLPRGFLHLLRSFGLILGGGHVAHRIVDGVDVHIKPVILAHKIGK